MKSLQLSIVLLHEITLKLVLQAMADKRGYEEACQTLTSTVSVSMSS